ncbi:uncharacterized protein LOC143239905 isoform X2 [Tachypleus tridentatus]|uniref:uncharacterized protein LOC143239905 isoform X2 n=1 Tax=Tachypleus tridentatus TaxID=6853 RepID=UPI003FD1060F
MAHVLLPCDMPSWTDTQRQLSQIKMLQTSDHLVIGLQKLYDGCSISLDPDDNPTKGDILRFEGLRKFIDETMTADEKLRFFKQTLPTLINSALKLRLLKPAAGFHFLLQQEEQYRSLDRRLLVSLLSNAFCSLLPKRTVKTHPTLQDFNFGEFFRQMKSLKQQKNLRNIFQYFDFVGTQEIKGKVRFYRQVLPFKSMPSLPEWLCSDQPLCPLVVRTQGTPNDAEIHMYRVCDCSSRIGGEVLKGAITEEASSLCRSPELLVSLCFVESLADNEALVVEGALCVDESTGSSLREADFCLMDAYDFTNQPFCQYEDRFLLRELNKALVSLKQPQSQRRLSPVGQSSSSSTCHEFGSPVIESDIDVSLSSSRRSSGQSSGLTDSSHGSSRHQVFNLRKKSDPVSSELVFKRSSLRGKLPKIDAKQCTPPSSGLKSIGTLEYSYSEKYRMDKDSKSPIKKCDHPENSDIEFKLNTDLENLKARNKKFPHEIQITREKQLQDVSVSTFPERRSCGNIGSLAIRLVKQNEQRKTSNMEPVIRSDENTTTSLTKTNSPQCTLKSNDLKKKELEVFKQENVSRRIRSTAVEEMQLVQRHSGSAYSHCSLPSEEITRDKNVLEKSDLRVTKTDKNTVKVTSQLIPVEKRDSFPCTKVVGSPESTKVKDVSISDNRGQLLQESTSPGGMSQKDISEIIDALRNKNPSSVDSTPKRYSVTSEVDQTVTIKLPKSTEVTSTFPVIGDISNHEKVRYSAESGNYWRMSDEPLPYHKQKKRSEKKSVKSPKNKVKTQEEQSNISLSLPVSRGTNQNFSAGDRQYHMHDVIQSSFQRPLNFSDPEDILSKAAHAALTKRQCSHKRGGKISMANPRGYRTQVSADEEYFTAEESFDEDSSRFSYARLQHQETNTKPFLSYWSSKDGDVRFSRDDSTGFVLDGSEEDLLQNLSQHERYEDFRKRIRRRHRGLSRRSTRSSRLSSSGSSDMEDILEDPDLGFFAFSALPIRPSSSEPSLLKFALTESTVLFPKLQIPPDSLKSSSRGRNLIMTTGDGNLKAYSYDGVNPCLPVPYKARFRLRRGSNEELSRKERFYSSSKEDLWRWATADSGSGESSLRSSEENLASGEDESADSRPSSVCSSIESTSFEEQYLEDKEAPLSRFLLPTAEGVRPAATGLWGIGRKGGDPQLKMIILWLAASRGGLPSLVVYTAGEPRLAQKMRHVAVTDLSVQYLNTPSGHMIAL